MTLAFGPALVVCRYSVVRRTVPTVRVVDIACETMTPVDTGPSRAYRLSKSATPREAVPASCRFSSPDEQPGSDTSPRQRSRRRPSRRGQRRVLLACVSAEEDAATSAAVIGRRTDRRARGTE